MDIHQSKIDRSRWDIWIQCLEFENFCSEVASCFHGRKQSVQARPTLLTIWSVAEGHSSRKLVSQRLDPITLCPARRPIGGIITEVTTILGNTNLLSSPESKSCKPNEKKMLKALGDHLSRPVSFKLLSAHFVSSSFFIGRSFSSIHMACLAASIYPGQ